jgi:hypothetical protein
MKPLETKFDRWGMTFVQLERVGDIVLYRNDQMGDLFGWMVAKIKKLPKSVFPNGAVYPPRECLPSKSEGGSKIWFYMPKNEEKAREHFKKLVEGNNDNRHK